MGEKYKFIATYEFVTTHNKSANCQFIKDCIRGKVVLLEISDVQLNMVLIKSGQIKIIRSKNANYNQKREHL